ncbi:MAG: 50S ribosomal protein L6 [gamma proteobacterium symbiont of Bathyaustriella thionipta]|nr:50S ribosomal protein L6 [gamma proteobacterium symbiont of Bathyaustriella thionipta]MCU7949048.1 50S ribosomal protein L6 [gamma proteobacterium symbiont of Bathyaustriella thionipta]MCU7952575.1 50S ribosomal protein L6 [gamma proteobacterium symbiont of Bathyaustriella thionipta]MCU7955655.1 50S ribosomal protein L6 [gamma proteobacterium symbiont of Bathyaustriella thionipta]MCU7968124.1 50S ribosomal protein L6 [gamma proteobacterium symbiont of Bathyaustriella thionipta]
MSRVTKPVAIPSGIEISQNGQEISVKGSKGQLQMNLNSAVTMTLEDGNASFAPVNTSDKNSDAIIGTMKSIVTNMMKGVSEGFEKKLTLIGVGYRAKAQGNKVDLSLGFSHPVEHELPEGITAETPSQTEIIIRGIDKQKVGQVAADIRAYRPPEPYKGKGVRYTDEYVVRKEAKKK